MCSVPPPAVCGKVDLDEHAYRRFTPALARALKHPSINNLPAGSCFEFSSLQRPATALRWPRLQVVAVACPQAFQSLMVTSVCINYTLTIQSTILG
jgi:hypothetical protein